MVQRRSPEPTDIHRQPIRFVGGYGGSAGGGIAFPTANVTSPQWWLDNNFSVDTIGFNAFTQAQDASTATFSAPSSLWIDLLFFGVAGSINSITIEGSTIDYIPFTGSNNVGYQVFDVYGYGVSAKLSLSGTFGQIAPAVPREVISENGSIVWPPGMTGYGAARDV